MDRTFKAVVYPGGTVSGYGHIYSLGSAGIHVVALNPKRCANFLSRHVKERHIVPDPRKHHAEFVEWLLDYGRRQSQKPVLFLAEDLYAYIAAHYQRDLGECFLYPFIPKENIDPLFNKRPMYEVAAAAGLHVPATLCSPFADEELERWGRFPAVVKPLVSRFSFVDDRLVDVEGFPKAFGAKAVLATDHPQLVDIVGRVREMNLPLCVQELIPGDNPQLAIIRFVAGYDHRIPSCFVSVKVRQNPADFGTAAVARSSYIPELHAYAEDFCRAARYVGPAGMEFKWDPDTRRHYFVEINPRLDFGIRMAALKGVNLPLQLYRLCTGQELEDKRQQEDGRHWIDVRGDLEGYRWRRRHPEYAITFGEFIAPYRSFDEAVWNLSDPIPGALQLFKTLATNLTPRRRV